MYAMSAEAHDTHITIRELQRNAADVFDRARRGHNFIVTRRGETVGRILPPDPAEEAVEKAIADGVLDAALLATLPSTADVANIEREPSPPKTRRGTDALLELRDEQDPPR